MLFVQIGREWAGLLSPGPADRSGPAERVIREALAAAASGELAAHAEAHGGELARYLPHLIERARTGVLDDHRDLEELGRVLATLGIHSTEAQAAGHFLVGYAQRSLGEGTRHFELARLAYRDLGRPVPECLSALAAEASRLEPKSEDRSHRRLTEAFGALAAADRDCSDRVAPAVRHHLLVLEVTRDLMAGGAPPAELPAVTEDDLHTLRSAMVAALDRPDRVAAIARWIQSLRGLPADSTGELDAMVAMLGEVHAPEPRIHLLCDLIAHGDRRPGTTLQLAKSLSDVGRWSEAKEALVARVGDRPGPEHLELVQFLAMLCITRGDPDGPAWVRRLRALGGDLPESAMPPPSQVAERRTPEPRAVYDRGSLTIDPGLAAQGQDAIAAHMRAAIVRGLPREQGAEFLADIARTEPELYAQVIALLPPDLRPRSAAEEHLARAERLFARRTYREAVSAYQQALAADPNLEYAHLGLGDAYYMLGEFHAAAAHFTESIAIRPTPQAYRFLGDALLKGRNDRRRAKECYEQALALDPEYGGARAALAHLERWGR
ncbi:tetratricopeptide repeat protein [Streptomyces sp. NPDC052101]|uniref:tetratricopeptide repeat protein n=1 Tax=Streptomyces sp. NPDC052101 TaxID=3155763 RepID=UPI00342CF009